MSERRAAFLVAALLGLQAQWSCNRETFGSSASTAHAAALVTLTRHFTPADRVTGRYQYVPFDVPSGTASLRVSYRYDRASGETVVDLGLFEPGSLEIGTSAFRGYSGGAKTDVVISAAETTGGYRPGPLPPGQWHVLLGLYKVQPAGVDVTLTIETAPGPPPFAPSVPTPLQPAPSTERGPRWYTGALHTHTLHSDGTVSPLDLLQKFRDARFDFVAMTDHNNTTHAYELGRALATNNASTASDPLWIIGEEVTTPAGHASVWGLQPGQWVDFRVRKGDKRIADLVKTTHGFGALFSINHPVSTCDGCGWEHEVVEGIDGIEISNGRHGEVAGSLARWDSLLRAGRRLTGVGSSDWHAAPNPIDVAQVRVHAAALTARDILDAIRAGRVVVMLRSGDPTPEITVRAAGQSARIGEPLRVDGATPVSFEVEASSLPNGQLAVVSNGERLAVVPLDSKGRARFDLKLAAGYVRFELSAGGTLVALTNPVYLTHTGATNASRPSQLSKR